MKAALIALSFLVAAGSAYAQNISLLGGGTPGPGGTAPMSELGGLEDFMTTTGGSCSISTCGTPPGPGYTYDPGGGWVAPNQQASNTGSAGVSAGQEATAQAALDHPATISPRLNNLPSDVSATTPPSSTPNADQDASSLGPADVADADYNSWKSMGTLAQSAQSDGQDSSSKTGTAQAPSDIYSPLNTFSNVGKNFSAKGSAGVELNRLRNFGQDSLTKAVNAQQDKSQAGDDDLSVQVGQ